MADVGRFREFWDEQASTYDRRVAFTERRFLSPGRASSTGEHLTRRPALLLPGAGLEVVESQRHRLGILERVHARRA